MLAEALAAVAGAAGRPVEGWLSPALSESPRTPDLLAAAGVRWVADWVNDDLPYRLRTATGPLWALPCGWETSDAVVMWQAHHTPDEWAQQLRDRFDQLHDEAGHHGGRLLGLTLHPWVVGQPHRIAAVQAVLQEIVAPGGVWPASAGELVQEVARDVAVATRTVSDVARAIADGVPLPKALVDGSVALGAVVLPQPYEREVLREPTIFLLHDFLSPGECSDHVARAEALGFEQASLGGGGVVYRELRDNDRVILDGIQKVKPGSPAEPEEWNLTPPK